MSIEQPQFFHPENQLASIVKLVAEINNVPISDETLRGVAIVASACGIADDELDRCQYPEKREMISRNAFMYLEGKEELAERGSPTHPAYIEAMGYLKEFYNSLSLKRQAVLTRNLRIWNILSEMQRSCASRERSM